MTANRLLGEGGELIRFCQPVAIVLRRRTAWHITSGVLLSVAEIEIQNFKLCRKVQ